MSDELTTDQLRELEADLHALEQQLIAALDASRDGARPVDLDQPIGRVSRIDAIQQQKMLESNRRNHQMRLSQVQAALRFLREGDYGLCRACEEPIRYRRLKARPESRFCLSCQSAREQR